MLQQARHPAVLQRAAKAGGHPDDVLKLGQLMGTEKVAGLWPRTFASARHAAQPLCKRPIVRSFYQVWDKPLYTLNGDHIVSDALRLCGGENIFDKLPATAPVVDRRRPAEKPGGDFRDRRKELWRGQHVEALRHADWRSAMITCSRSTATC